VEVKIRVVPISILLFFANPSRSLRLKAFDLQLGHHQV
jgi:hypothetical protein